MDVPRTHACARGVCGKSRSTKKARSGQARSGMTVNSVSPRSMLATKRGCEPTPTTVSLADRALPYRTWGATRTADTSGGFEGARTDVDPDEDSKANASVLTPPSFRVMHEDGEVHDALEVGPGTTYASYPRRTVSSRAPVHSPSQTKERDVMGRGM